MEIPYIPDSIVSKVGDPAKPQKTDSRAVADVYQKTVACSDEVTISAQSRLMAQLSTEYIKLEDNSTAKIERIISEVEVGIYEMTVEEIVEGILRGTLFDIL